MDMIFAYFVVKKKIVGLGINVAFILYFDECGFLKLRANCMYGRAMILMTYLQVENFNALWLKNIEIFITFLKKPEKSKKEN